MQKTTRPKRGSWIFAYDLEKADINYLVRLGFDETIIDDALDYFEVPRFEFVDGINYLFTRYPIVGQDGELSTAPILIAVSNEYLVTISHNKPEFLDDFAHGRKEMITTQKTKAVLLILEVIVNNYEQTLLQIRRQMLQYFGNIESVSEKDIKKIVAIENRLADYISALSPTVNALENMISRRGTMTLHKNDVEIVEDLIQDANQVVNSAKGVSQTARNIRSAHEGILAYQLNATMKTLTGLTIVLMVPTIITGLFGMNTWLPFTDGPGQFLIIIFLMTILSLTAVRWLQKNNWF